MRHHRPVTAFDDLLPALDARLERLREESRIPGVAWGVVRDGAAGPCRRRRHDPRRRGAAPGRGLGVPDRVDDQELHRDGPAPAARRRSAPPRRSGRGPRPGARRVAAADGRLAARHDPPADDDVGRPRHRRPVGRPPAGPADRRVRAAPRRRSAVRLAARHGLRVLEPGLRDPRARRHGGRRRGVPGLRPRPDPRAAGHGVDRLPGRGRPRGAPRPRLHAARRRAHPRGRGPVRRAGLDGRRVLERPRPRSLGRRASSTPSRPATTPRATTRSAARRGARCSRSSGSIPRLPRRPARPRGAVRRRPRLRLRAPDPVGHGARHGRSRIRAGTRASART